jgi:hypothetical protein
MSEAKGFAAAGDRRATYYDAEGNVVHVCDETCGHLDDVDGDGHVLTDDGSAGRPDCPHPDHDDPAR